MIHLALTLLAAAIGGLLLRRALRRKTSGPLPPGPKGWPIIGSLLDMPTQKSWLTFSQWGNVWGDICSVTVLGQPIIIVNSVNVASEILDKKSAIYADRPELPMGGEIIGWKDALTLLRYGRSFNQYRKHFHQAIGTQASAKKFHPFEEAMIRRFLRRVLDEPENLHDHILRTAGAVSLRTSYGYTAESDDDPFVQLINYVMHNFSKVSAPGAFFIDLFPALRHIPSWFPGGSFHKKAKVWARDLASMVDNPFNYSKEQFSSGHVKDSYLTTAYEPGMDAEAERLIKWTASTMGAAGLYTRLPGLQAFFLAMSLFPEAQRKAQAEIDAVIGSDRLPTFEDRERLPYVDALVKEVLRFHSVVPTGLPHMAMEDDVHDGYFIPKGTIIIANIWNMLHDPRVYTDPMNFDPSRFIGSKDKQPERDVTEFMFGFGRRVCPGRVPAYNSVFIMAASSLAVFNISKYVEDGVVVEPIVDQTTGTVSQPTPFKCSIKPRSEATRALVVEVSNEIDLGPL